MQRVFVLNSDKEPLMPCHPARARILLNKKRARVFRLYPFGYLDWLEEQKVMPVESEEPSGPSM